MNQGTRRRSNKGYFRAALLVALSFGVPQTLAAAEEIVGIWNLTTNAVGWQAFGTLSITRNADGTLTGKWGSMDLSNVKFNGQRLTFTRPAWNGGMDFSGTLKDGMLMLADERGGKATGVRRMSKSPVLGQWDLKVNVGGLDLPVRLVVSQKANGTPEATWATDFAETVVTGVNIAGDKLTLSQETTFENGAFASTFDGTVQGHTLTGTIKSQLGNTPVTGRRIGIALIGEWELTLSAPQGQRTDVLTIDTDLSGRYERGGTLGGEVPIKDLKLQGDQASFKTEVSLGDRIDVTEYKLKLDGKILKGQLASARGTVELTGRKIDPLPSGALAK